jgi:hypothetical protein
MDYFTKWLEAYSILNQEALTVAEVIVTNFFCHLGVPWELQAASPHVHVLIGW